ncbi:MAG: hypothetical protein Q8P53_03730 [Candidatus Shapirobacteria bacterium]|nr:hypothetical protein [Candidatus Shapirobacteria bacterium]
MSESQNGPGLSMKDRLFSKIKEIFPHRNNETQKPSVTALTISSAEAEESVEYDLPYAYIPSGDPEKPLYERTTEPSEEELKRFFTPEMISRLVKCPQIKVDETDDWGMFGYEPGYFFVCESRYKGAKRFNDKDLLIGRSLRSATTSTGYSITEIQHADSFPRDKFDKQTITASKTPRTFAFLRKLLDNVNPNDITTYLIEDLYNTLDNLKKIKDMPSVWEEELNKLSSLTKYPNESDNTGLNKDMATLRERIKEDKKEIPNETLKRLQITNAIREREVVDPAKLAFFKSFKEEQSQVQQAIEQAKQAGNDELATSILDAFEKGRSFLEGKVYLPKSSSDQKLLT